ncbi:MAG: hypothetical protein WD824_00635 [Cyclobacteriaceae bacterium]
MKRIYALLTLCLLVFSTGFFSSCRDEEEEPKIEVANNGEILFDGVDDYIAI